MKKLIQRLIWIPVGIVLVVFFVANRRPVAVSLDPLSTEHPAIATPELPFWVWLFAALLVGFFTGAVGLWMSQKDSRHRIRAERRELKELRREIAALREAPRALEEPSQPASVLPAPQ